MNFTHFALSLACAGALAFTQSAAAQGYGGQAQTQSDEQQPSGASQGQVKLSSHDQKFLRSAAESDLAGIQAGQIAQQKSTNPQVKQFAQRQVQTHQNTMNRLNNIAQQSNVTLPTQVNSNDQKAISRLQSASSANFDQEYTRWVAQNNQKALNSYQKEAQSGQNPMLKSFASSNISEIQTQTQQAQNLQRGTSAAAGQSTGQSTGQSQSTGQTGQQSNQY